MTKYKMKVVYEIEINTDRHVEMTEALCDDILDSMKFHDGSPEVVRLQKSIEVQVRDCVVSCFEDESNV